MVGHDEMCPCRYLTGAVKETDSPLVIGTSPPEAIVPLSADPRPERKLPANKVDLGAIACLGRWNPNLNPGQKLDHLQRQAIGLAQTVPAPQTEVVRSTLHLSHLNI